MEQLFNKFSQQMLAITVVLCLSWPATLSVTAANLTWVGDGVNNNWDVGVSLNWLNGSTSSVFHNGDNTTFNDTGSATPAINLTTTVTPGSVVVAANLSYAFGGNGRIAGSGGVTKNGTGSLTILETNTYSGGTIINAGAVQIGNGGTIGWVSGAIADNGTLAFNRADAVTFPGVISGMGALIQMGPGTLTLSGANTYSGTTTVSAGTLATTTASLADGAYSVGDGASFNLTVTSANGQLSPANLTLGTSTGATIGFNFGSFGSSVVAPLHISGNLVLNGINVVNLTNVLPQVGEFPLIQYAGTLSGSAANFSLGTLPAGVVASIVTTTPGLVLLDIVAVAPTNQSLVYQGLTNSSLGSATLALATTNTLQVGNLGTNGQDGVSIALPSNLVGLDVCWQPLDVSNTLPVGAYLQSQTIGTANGITNGVLDTITMTKAGTTNYHISADFSPLGASTYTVRACLNGVLVAQATNLPGTLLGSCNQPLGDQNPLNTNELTLPGKPWLTLPGGPTVTCDALFIIPENVTLTNALTAFNLVASEVPSLTITSENASLMFQGLANTSLGNATLALISTNTLQVGNLGTNGQDGVSIALPGNLVGLDVCWQSLDVSNTLPVGAYFQSQTIGTANGITNGVLDTITVTKAGTTNYQISADYSPLGASTYTVQAYRNGALVAQATNLPGTLLANCNIWIADHNPFTGELTWHGEWPSWVKLAGGVTVTCDALFIIPENVTQTNALTAVQITASQVPALTITSENASLVYDGLTDTSLGNAVVSVSGNGLTVGDIGSSGQDGVAVALPCALPGLEMDLEPLDDSNLLPAGAYVQEQAIGTANGIANGVLGTAVATKAGTSNYVVSADFSPLGASNYTVQAYLQGILVAQATNQTGATVAQVNMMPLSFDIERVSLCGCCPPWNFYLTFDWDHRQILILIPGYAAVTCDQLFITPDNVTLDGPATALQITASQVPALSMTTTGCMSVACSNVTSYSCSPVQVFYPTPAVTDPCCGTNWSVAFSPVNGSYFAPGTTNMVECVAWDGCGNSNSCSFTVTVLCPSPACSCIGSNSVFAATAFRTVHNFNYNTDGAYADAGLILSGTNFYGTAMIGGSLNYGTVFKLDTNGAVFTVLYTFANGNDGANPQAGLVLSGTNLYGTTAYGGSAGYGTVFALSTNGSAFRTLYSFTNGTDGANPQAGLVLSGTNLYGTAVSGGSSRRGTVFVISTNGVGFETLHSFTGGSDGAYPQAGLVLSGTNLYGTAANGGSSGYYGTVFAVNTNGSVFKTLYNFTGGDDGGNPMAGLTLSGTNLYGTAWAGGSSDYGTVFVVSTNGAGFETLHSFSRSADGANPQAGLVLSGTNLYGTASAGGSSGYGTVFALHANGTGFTTLYNFTDGTDGADPYSGLILVGTNLWGTASAGGASFAGTVFALGVTSLKTNCLEILPPTNMVVTAANYIQEFYAPTVTDLVCSNVTVWCNPPSGSYFAPNSTNEVTCYASDCCDNSNYCSFTVIVLCTNCPVPNPCSYSVYVSGASGPWNWNDSLNSQYAYGESGSVNSPPTVVNASPGLPFNPGDLMVIRSLTPGIPSLLLGDSGMIWSDANGYTPWPPTDASIGYGVGDPAWYTGSLVYGEELMGTFADGTGAIVGNPFVIGNGPRWVPIPMGASELLMGVNDAWYNDNGGIVEVCLSEVSSNDCTNGNISILCPNDMVFTSNVPIQVSYTPTVADNCCSNVIVVCNPPSGSYFQPSTVNNVLCVATDNCGNSNYCSFTVTVLGAAPPVIVSGPTNISICASPVGIGSLIVDSDEWVLSDPGYLNETDGAVYIQNCAAYLAGGKGSNILISSSNYGLIGTNLYNTLTSAGYAVTKSQPNSNPLTPAYLVPFNAVFVGGDNLDQDALTALQQFICSGGGVYIAAGTGTITNTAGVSPSPAAEAEQWNILLNPFGLTLSSSYNNIYTDLTVANSLLTVIPSPVMAGVTNIFYCLGNDVSVLGGNALAHVIAYSGADGLIGVSGCTTAGCGNMPDATGQVQVSANSQVTQSIPPGTAICANTNVTFTVTNDIGEATNLTVPVTLMVCTNYPGTNCLVIQCTNSLLILTCSNTAVQVFYPLPTVTDLCCGTNWSVAFSPTNGSSFMPGTTNDVLCMAWDSCGNTNYCSFTVTVLPPPPLVVTCPGDITVMATNSMYAVVYCGPTVSGGTPPYATNDCASLPYTTNFNSWQLFMIGTHSITCCVSDSCGQTNSCSFTVKVLPCFEVGGLSNVVVTSCVPVQVSFSPTVTANCCSNGSGTVVMNPTNGSYFNPNTTNWVEYYAADSCGDASQVGTLLVKVVCNCVPAPTNLVLWLPFDETNGTISANLASPPNFGTQIGHPTPIVGEYVSNSLSFDGTGDQYVTVPNYPGIEIGTNDFSIDAWIQCPTDTNNSYTVLDKRTLVGGIYTGYIFDLYYNVLLLQMDDGYFIGNNFDTNTLPADNGWHFVAVTVRRTDPNGLQFYVDGQFTGSCNPTTHEGSLANSAPMQIGGSTLANSYWLGGLDEVEVFNRALTGSEIQSIYSAGMAGKCKCLQIQPPTNMSVYACSNVQVFYPTNFISGNVGCTNQVVFDPTNGSYFARETGTLVNWCVYDCSSTNISASGSFWVSVFCCCTNCCTNCLNYTNYTVTVVAGSNYLADNLCQGMSNTLADVLPSVPEETKVSFWNQAAGAFYPADTFSASKWQDGTEPMFPGEGFLLVSPVNTNLTIYGCLSGCLGDCSALNCSSPTMLVGGYGVNPVDFSNLFCPPVPAGTEVQFWNASSQSFTTYTYNGAWTPIASPETPPALPVGCSEFVTVEDTSPVIYCPPDIVTNGLTDVAVSYTVTASNIVGGTLTSVNTGVSPVSPHPFPCGTTTVTCLATNACGQVSTCSFTVTVYCALIHPVISGGTLTLSWPAGQNYVLMWQTNIAAPTNSWLPVAGAADGSYNITVDPAGPAVFYRLRSP